MRWLYKCNNQDSCHGGQTTVRQVAKRIELLSAIAAVVAYPAVAGFVLLWLIEQHGGLLGFGLIWVLGAGVILRVYAQFLRLWHRVGYPPAAKEAAAVPSPRTVMTVRAGPPSAIPVANQATGLGGPDERSSSPVLRAKKQVLALTSPGPPAAFVLTALRSPDERSPTLTSPMTAGTDGAREEAEEWLETLREEWAEAEAKLGIINEGLKGVGKRGRRIAA